MKKEKHMFSKKTLVLKTLSMPQQKNANGNVFGGWIISKMDIGGAILAKELTGGNVVTVKVVDVNFLKPIKVGDLIHCYAKFVKVGNTSITIDTLIWVKKLYSSPFGKCYTATKGRFIYVAINNTGQPRNIPLMSVL